MRVLAALPHALSMSEWARRNSVDEVPDRTPYGLHHLASHGIDISFVTYPNTFSGAQRRLASALTHRTSGLELVETAAVRRQLSAMNTDLVLAYDERNGVPAALIPKSRRAPVITGVGWLNRRCEATVAMRMAAGRALPRADAVWTQSSPIVDRLISEWGVPRAAAHFVPLGIDTDFYAWQPWPDPDLVPVVASAGEDRFRDHDLLVSAVAAVRRSVPDTQLHLATQLPVSLPDDWGRVYRERLDGRIRRLYRRSALVAVALRPTSTGSGLTVILEGMASGRPVVVTANPGVSDYVTHGVTGLLVPPGDDEAFASAIAELLRDPARCREMGAAAAADVRRRFSSRVMAAHLAGVIDGVRP